MPVTRPHFIFPPTLKALIASEHQIPDIPHIQKKSFSVEELCKLMKVWL